MFARLIEMLFSLRLIKPEDLSRARLSFELPTEWLWVCMLLLVGVAALGVWSYRRQAAQARRRRAMAVVRALVLALLVVFLCKPAIKVDQELTTRSVVAVWVDNSLSMGLRDPYTDPAMRTLVKNVSETAALPANEKRADRFDLAVDALEHPKEAWLQKLLEKQEVAVLTGGPHAQVLGVARSPAELATILDQLKNKVSPSSNSTDLPTAVADTFRLLQGQPVSAVVLVTDGRSTEPTRLDEATSVARQNATPLFALPVGDSSPPLNIAIQNMDAPDNTFVNDPVAVKVKLHATGITRPTRARLTLFEKGREETPLKVKDDIALDANKQDVDAEMIFKPAQAGKLDLVAKVDPIGEELTLAHHADARTVNVLDAKIRVLYVDGYPRWEYRYLKNEFIREKTVDVSCLLLSADDNFAQEGDVPITRFPESVDEMNKYDVILVGDVDPNYFSPLQQKLIVDFVAKTGGGFGMIAGPQYAPDAYRGTPLEALLPVVPQDPASATNSMLDNAPFSLVLTPTGRDTNLFRFFDDPDKNAEQVANLGSLYYYHPVLGLKGAAEVLAVHPNRTIGGQPAPLLVAGRYGAGRTYYSAVADTWRWRFYKGEPLYQTYWLQVARLLYRNKALGASRRIDLLAESNKVELGNAIKFDARVLDPTLAGQMPAQFALQVTDDQGRAVEPVTLSRVGTTGDDYEGLMTASTLGHYVARATPGSLPVETPEIPFEVKLPDREFADPTADPVALAALTRGGQSNPGKVVPLPEAGELASLIPDRSIHTAHPIIEEIWNKPIALVLVVGLLTLEWLLRKASGLI